MDHNAKADALQLTLGDVKDFFAELGLENLPDDRKQQMLDTALDTILDRILLRVAPVLTEQDQQMIENLEQKKDACFYTNRYGNYQAQSVYGGFGKC